VDEGGGFCGKNPYNGNLQESSQIQFHQNLKEEKKVASNWERTKKMKDDRVLKEVEEALEVLYNSEGFGI
jgi:ribosome-binding protein aMBF1 (putative translation factor)